MISLLLALGPALLSFAIFAATLLRVGSPPKVTTKAEREWIAARSRLWGRGVFVVSLLLVLGAVAFLHFQDFRSDPFIPQELS